MTYFIGLDMGTTHIKCALYNAKSGKIEAMVAKPTPLNHPLPELSEHDPETLWQTASTCISEAAGDRQIEALSISSFAEAGLPIDKNGQPLFPVIAWFDRRSESQAQWLEKQRSIEQLFLITGQRIDPSFGSIKWMWLCQNHPDVAKHTHRWLSVPDYIFWRLTGSQATDYTLASRTLLLDQRKLDWSQEMLELVGLKYNQLPPIFPSGSLVGKVTRQASGECGLRYGTPCYLGGHDHLCAALAGGASHAGVAIDSSGTAQAILITLPTFLSDPRIPEKGYACYAHVVPGLYILKAGLKAAGGAIDWLVRQLAGLNAGEKDLPFAELERAAIEGVGKHVGPLWLPHFIGSGSPDGDRFSQGALIGIQLHHSQGDIFRGLLEGLAFWSKDNIETMQELSGQVIKQGFALGGLTRIALLTQLKADILNIPVAVPKIPEASATGAALLAALGCGYFNSPDEAVGSICYDHIIYAPHSERVDWYENLFRRVYKQMYPALAKINKDLDTLRNLPPQYKGNTKSN